MNFRYRTASDSERMPHSTFAKSLNIKETNRKTPKLTLASPRYRSEFCNASCFKGEFFFWRLWHTLKKLLITASFVVLFVRFSLHQTSLASNDHDETHSFAISAVALLINVQRRSWSGSEIKAPACEVAAKYFDLSV